ncbi:MAG: diversity-generating retroelement protein Avd [Deltaproteobacteria bacterium]|nr:MAG: diversity-generating retroelement protein Avd [Deltaproteobacteria bacterium]
MKRELPAIQRAYDLSKELFPRVAKFPKDYKFSLGQRIIDNSLDNLELLIEAAYTSNKSNLLQEANIRLERLRFLLRLSRDLGSLSDSGYEHIMKMINNLGKQIGGWRKQASAKG